MKDTLQAPRRNVATILAHTIFIIMLFVLPELVMAIAMPHRHQWTFYPGFYLKAFVFLGVFYLNYFYLVDRQLGQEKPRIWRFVGLNALLIVGVLVLTSVLQSLFIEVHLPRRWDEMTNTQQIATLASFMLRDAVMLILAIGLAAAMRLSSRWSDIQQQRQKLLLAQRSSELESLKSQLNPHFLFNTLNSIYALIDLNSEDAKSAVHKLSGMLRYMLYEDQPAVPLQREAEFIENYVSLMQLRLRVSDHPLQVSIIDADQAKGLTAPPLIFIPLIENALKYGIGAAPGTPVEITLTVSENRIVCRTVNGFAHTGKTKESGIGLANLRRRLVLIYGSAASLRTSISENVFTSELTLPGVVPPVQPTSKTEIQ